jgi:hypothetical protein
MAILRQAALCSECNYLSVNATDTVTLIHNAEEEKIKVPAGLEALGAIEEFCTGTGIRNYLYVQLDEAIQPAAARRRRA